MERKIAHFNAIQKTNMKRKTLKTKLAIIIIIIINIVCHQPQPIQFDESYLKYEQSSSSTSSVAAASSSNAIIEQSTGFSYE